MEKRVEKDLRGLLLLLIAVFMMSLTTAFAQDTGIKIASYASVDINDNIEMIMSSMDYANSGAEKNDADLLLDELSQPDTSSLTDQTGKVESCGINECPLATHR